MSARAAGRRRTSSPVESDSTATPAAAAACRRSASSARAQRCSCPTSIVRRGTSAFACSTVKDLAGFTRRETTGSPPGSRDIPTPVSALSDWGAGLQSARPWRDEDPSEASPAAKAKVRAASSASRRTSATSRFPTCCRSCRCAASSSSRPRSCRCSSRAAPRSSWSRTRSTATACSASCRRRIPRTSSPEPDGLYSRGTAGRILKMLKYPDGSVRILVQGLRRIEVAAATTQREPYLAARVRQLHDVLRAVAGPRGDAGAHGQPVRQVRLDDPLPARRAAGRGDEHQGSGQGHRPDRLEPEHLARGEAGARCRRSTCARASSGCPPSSTARSSCSSSGTRSSRRCSPSSTRTRRSSTCASR